MRLAPHVLVLLATLLAAVTRILGVDTLPPRVWFDEIWFAYKARELLQGAPLEAYYKTYWGGVHPFMVVLTALAQQAGFLSPIAPRLISVPAGILSIPLAYATLTRLFHGSRLHAERRAIAALCALVLSALPAWIVVARIGLEWPIAATLTLFIVWSYHRGLASAGPARVLSGLACGLVLGMGQYLSQHMRFVLPLILLFALLDGIARRRYAGGIARQLSFAGLIFSTAALAAMPLLLRFAGDPALLTARAAIITNTHGLSRAEFIAWNVWLVAQSFFVHGSRSTLENVPGRALFDLLQQAGFLAGLLWSLCMLIRESVARKLWLWLLVLSLPTLLTEGAPSFERMTHAIPAAVALVAIGWVSIARAAERVVAAPRLLHMTAAALLTLSTAVGPWAYFVDYPRAPQLLDEFTGRISVLTDRLIADAAARTVFVERITESENMVHFDYLLPNTQVRYLDFRQCLPLSSGRATESVYVVNTQRDKASLPALRAAYPGAVVTEQPSESIWLIDAVSVMTAPARAEAVIALSPVDAQFAPGIDLRGYALSRDTLRAGESLFLTLYWHARSEVPADLTAFVHIAADTSSAPVAQRDGKPCQGFHPTSAWRPGDLTPDAFAVTLPADLPPGDYGIYVGMYSFPSFERAPLRGAGRGLDAQDNRIRIATVRVTAQ